MAAARLDVKEIAGSTYTLPITLNHKGSATSYFVAASFIFCAACFLLMPFGMLVALAAYEPNSVWVIARNPSTAIQLGLALVVGLVFVTYPLRCLLQRMRSPRSILIDEGTVSATGTRQDGKPTWSEPLSAYQGVTHHIRTTLSGAHHEIVLIHAEASKSVVLQTADRIAQPQVDAVAALLNVAEIPARTLYERTRPQALQLHLKAA